MGADASTRTERGSPRRRRRRARTTGDRVVMRRARTSTRAALAGVALACAPGEIVGVAGVEGNGQEELVARARGRRRARRRARSSADRVAVVREDRQAEGLVLDASLRDNLVLGELESVRSRRSGVLDVAALEREARARLERSARPTDLDRAARTLSGGNQQKIVVARALARDAQGARRGAADARRRPRRVASTSTPSSADAAKRGAGVLVISADLDELRTLASRILVLARGRIVAELPPTATDDELGRIMLGAVDGASPMERAA